MAEINNSLALGVKPFEMDVGKTLGQAATINSLRAGTAKTQQDIDYNQRLQDQGQNGMRPQEENTLANAHSAQLNVAGQIGNAMVNAKTPEDRQQAIQMSHDAGKPVPAAAAQHLMEVPLAQFHQYGQNMQKAGQSSTANIEQSPAAGAQRSYMGAAGATAGTTGGDLPGVPSVPLPAMQDRPANAPIRMNPDGGIQGNLATQPVAPAAQMSPAAPVPRVNPLAQKGITEAQNAERTANAAQNSAEFTGYKQASQSSPLIKNSLRQIIDDSDRAYTGPAGDRRAAAQRAVYAATKLPGIGPLIEHFAGDMSDPVAAIENIRKNVGIISRQAVGDIGERSAAALDNVQRSIPTEVTSHKGIGQAANQLMAVEDFKQARTIESTRWLKTHGTLDGFASDWTQNMGPATFVMARLPKEEQLAVRKRMSATPEGKRSLDQIDKQIDWAKSHGLGSVID